MPQAMRKGFIGPIGDDLPTMLIILLALGLFFSSVVFAFDLYNQKNEALRVGRGSLEIAKVFTSRGILSEADLSGNELKGMADRLAVSYNLEYGAYFTGSTEPDVCTGAYRYSFIVARRAGQDAELAELMVCVRGK